MVLTSLELKIKPSEQNSEVMMQMKLMTFRYCNA